MPPFSGIDGTNEIELAVQIDNKAQINNRAGYFDALAQPGRRNTHRFDGMRKTTSKAQEVGSFPRSR